MYVRVCMNTTCMYVCMRVCVCARACVCVCVYVYKVQEYLT
jgi:hypothetical protein